MCTYKKFCCCCCNVVTCAKWIAILSLIAGAINLISGLLSIIAGGSIVVTYIGIFAENPVFEGIFSIVGLYPFLWISVILTLVWMIPDALMLYGINKTKPGFMMPWLVLKMILLVVFTIWSVAAVILVVVNIELVKQLAPVRGSFDQNRQQSFDFENLLGGIQGGNEDLRNKLQNLQNLHNQNVGQTLQSVTIVMIIVWAVGLSVANALGYYLWDIVKSAYKQIKEENETNQHAIPYHMTTRNTYEQKPPAYQV